MNGKDAIMKRIGGWILLSIMLLSLFSTPALAVDNSRNYTFDLSVNGANEATVQPGDIVTVVFTLQRTDSGDPYTMYAMQNEIKYDEAFVKPVEGGTIVSSSVQTRDLELRSGGREFYMNFVSFADGEQWNARQVVGTFQLEVIGTSGMTVLSNENYKVTLRDGSDQYQASANDLKLIISDQCVVTFETDGGSVLENVNVRNGELLPRPEDPVKEGFHVEGWYSDVDLTQEWDFENSPVVSNMTLYVKWAEGNPSSGSFWTRILDGLKTAFEWIKPHWWVLLIPLALIALLLILLLGGRQCRVIFESNGGTQVPTILVKRGDSLENLPNPTRSRSVFGGWYKDAALTKPWYAGMDKVTKKKTKLYAKWR